LKIDVNVHSKSSVADPDPGSGVFPTPGYGIQIRDGKKSRARIQEPG